MEFIHETIRSFLLKSELCPHRYRVQTRYANARIAIACLRLLCNEEPMQNPFYSYAATHLVWHLSNSDGASSELLKGLHTFYDLLSKLPIPKYYGIDHDRLRKDLDPGLQTLNVEDHEPLLHAATKWLLCCLLESEQNAKETTDLQPSVQWRNKIQERPKLLVECVGRAAGRIWLYSRDIDNLRFFRSTFDSGTNGNRHVISTAFKVALKCYFTSRELGTSKHIELKRLERETFAPLSQWIVR